MNIAYEYQKDVLQRAVDNVTAHDKETRRMLDAKKPVPIGTYADRSATRVQLVEHVMVAAESLLRVLP